METRALFREIHKNSFLKRKAKRYWVVFCVHDDTIPVLEGYVEPRLAPLHAPEWSFSLQTTQHVSHSLVPQENEFVITTHNEVLRFNAPSWDLMIEWVESIRSKLREMKILSPKENVYSRMPEARLPLLPTRDPTSPLPAVPPIPAAIVLGIERPPPAPTPSTSSAAAPAPPPPSASTAAMSNTSIQNIMNLLSDPLSPLSRAEENGGEPEVTRRRVKSARNAQELPSLAKTFTDNVLADPNTCPPSNGTSEDADDTELPETIVIPRPQTARTSQKSTVADDDASADATNITIIQVSTPPPESAGPAVFKFPAETEKAEDEEFKSNVQIIPSNGVVAEGVVTTVQVAEDNYGKVFVDSTAAISVTNISISSASPSAHYEQVFLSSTAAAAAPKSSRPRTTSQSEEAAVTMTARLRNENKENRDQPSTSNIARPALTRGLTEANITRPSRSSERDVSSRSRLRNIAENPAADRLRGEVGQEHRKRSSSASDIQISRRSEPRRLQPAPTPYRPTVEGQQPPNGAPGGGRMTLREQQVMHLRREMMHPGGVRLQLRRKDCLGSIGWVDAFGSVWVAGWKQKEHPMLYNALHIGDQLVSVAGTPATTAAEANKTIKAVQGLFVELIIRRVPFGRVYAIKREIEGQCLGLIRDGNTATIVEVVPNSLAARHGLPPKAPTCDGLSLTFWVLTEINGRPLNLFFKDNEIKERLNSVGRDISILVQPLDLATKLRKQLKSLRGYKDFIVQ